MTAAQMQMQMTQPTRLSPAGCACGAWWAQCDCHALEDAHDLRMQLEDVSNWSLKALNKTESVSHGVRKVLTGSS